MKWLIAAAVLLLAGTSGAADFRVENKCSQTFTVVSKVREVTRTGSPFATTRATTVQSVTTRASKLTSSAASTVTGRTIMLVPSTVRLGGTDCSTGNCPNPRR